MWECRYGAQSSVLVFAQHQFERGLSGAIGFRHGFEIDLGMIDRTGPASAINLPPPRLWRAGAVFNDNGKIGVFDHGCDNTAKIAV
jgi:hypothetical protein